MESRPSASVQVKAGGLSASELEYEVRLLLDDLARPDEERVDDVVIDLSAEHGAALQDGAVDFATVGVQVVPAGQGWDGQGVDLLINFVSEGLAALAVETVAHLWERVLKRSLERRVGADAIGDTVEVKIVADEKTVVLRMPAGGSVTLNVQAEHSPIDVALDLRMAESPEQR